MIIGAPALPKAQSKPWKCIEFNKFPICTISSFDISSLGNNQCDLRLNTMDCGFDLGDCIEFNSNYPNYTASFPYRIGNGICNSQYNVLHVAGTVVIACELRGMDMNTLAYTFHMIKRIFHV